MQSVVLPLRIDLLGGWSDQLTWPSTAAVINASVGWEGGYMGGYPLRVYRDGNRVAHDLTISGIGTGLGVSSIIHAGDYILNHGLNSGYIDYVLQKEREEGTCGGWQDQIGGVAAGVKLIESDDHHTFSIQVLPEPQIVEHIVLYDTGERRRAQAIGDRVRELFATQHFAEALAQNVADAKRYFRAEPTVLAKACVVGWQRLCGLVDGMDISPPNCSKVLGHKLCGAGGGGYGIAFVDNPSDRDHVIKTYRSHGLWATKLILLPGAIIRD